MTLHDEDNSEKIFAYLVTLTSFMLNSVSFLPLLIMERLVDDFVFMTSCRLREIKKYQDNSRS